MKRVQKSKESESTPTIGSKIKTFLIKTFFVALVLGVAFGAGTFKPNYIVVKQIQQDEDRKMVALAKEFGLHEPDFTFKNKIKGKIGTFSFKNGKVTQDLDIYKTDKKKFIKF